VFHVFFSVRGSQMDVIEDCKEVLKASDLPVAPPPTVEDVTGDDVSPALLRSLSAGSLCAYTQAVTGEGTLLNCPRLPRAGWSCVDPRFCIHSPPGAQSLGNHLVVWVILTSDVLCDRYRMPGRTAVTPRETFELLSRISQLQRGGSISRQIKVP
jgi:hypothetical protein